MYRYELLILAIPAITQDELGSLETQIQEVITRAGASVLSLERWGKFRLAYPVNRNEYGVFILIRFEAQQVPSAVLDGIKTLVSVELRNVVMRFVINMLDPKGSLEYHRPPSLEETPQKEVGSFTRGEGRGRHEGRGGRSGFHRTRGPRGEGDYGRGGSRREFEVTDKNESGDEMMMNGEAE